jgi:hypothetical protein
VAFRLIDADPPAEAIRRITFVPFLPNGNCVLIQSPDRTHLPAGEVLAGEDYLLDTVLRVPLQTAGFRYQHFRPVGLDGDHLYAWIEGAPRQRTADLIAHHLRATVQPGTGRLLVSDYGAGLSPGARTAGETLRELGFGCDGESRGGARPGRPPAPTAWINARL